MAMLKDAASNAQPTKYVQNRGHGINLGTICIMPLAAEKCSAPNTARGMAKHKLLKTTILSRPRAREISAFAAHNATQKSTMLAPHIDTAVREISKNVARMVGYMWTPAQKSLLYQGTLPGLNPSLQIVRRRVGGRAFVCEAKPASVLRLLLLQTSAPPVKAFSTLHLRST